jgi:pimeloyl-ACP methyl ester carboxylesterase
MTALAHLFHAINRSFAERRGCLAGVVGLAIAGSSVGQVPSTVDVVEAPPPPKDRYFITWRIPKTDAGRGDSATALSTEKAAGDSSAETRPAEPEAAAASTPAGRLILFLVPDTPRFAGVAPAEGPFFESLQPIVSMPVASQVDGAVVEFDFAQAAEFRGALETLDGAWRVQAVLDTDFTERGHLGPGNLVSVPLRVELASDRADEVRLELSEVLPAVAPTPDDTNTADERAGQATLVWIERKSELLSRHFGREFKMRAGVVLPYGYHDLSFPRRMWPSIYVVGGFGANHLAAADAAPALQSPQARAAIPQAAWIFLDADTPWGHSGFVDSETNGPIGRALVEEFIPYLEERFRLVRATEARIVTGHSSGGWTAIHLVTTYPEVFGAAFASAPDPVDFSAFQETDLYRDHNLFVSSDGRETPSYRGVLGPSDDRVFMTVRDEVASENAIDPNGRSGCQWAAWDAMWSPFDLERAAPRPLCDAATGEIDPVTVEAWSRHDIARRFTKDPARIGRILEDRVRILCGTRDSYYLQRAVARLKAKVEAWKADARTRGAPIREGDGSIELIDGLTHDTIYAYAQIRFHQEMVAYLRARGLADAPPVAGGTRRNDDESELERPLRDDRPAPAPAPTGG